MNSDFFKTRFTKFTISIQFHDCSLSFTTVSTNSFYFTNSFFHYTSSCSLVFNALFIALAASLICENTLFVISSLSLSIITSVFSSILTYHFLFFIFHLDFSTYIIFCFTELGTWNVFGTRNKWVVCIDQCYFIIYIILTIEPIPICHFSLLLNFRNSIHFQ